MGLIEIVITICAVAQPSDCRVKHLQFVYEGSLSQCAKNAQLEIAKWIGDNPDWFATRWRCEDPQRRDKEI